MKATILLCALIAAFPAAAQEKKRSDAQVDRGRYLVKIGGCHDCHTPGYPQTGGKVSETEYLVGTALGWRGPWGTTYAPNLRLYMQGLSEDDWVKNAKTLTTRPPMPWFNLHAMTPADLRAMYRYIRYLGPGGKPAPAYLPPAQTPPQPFVQFPEK